MRVGVGIILIVTASVLFVLLLPKNTPAALVTSPLFVVGFGFVFSKVQEMEEDIARLEKELNEFIKGMKK